MSARKKTKLCWHCHGTIPIEVTHCAYCGEHCEPHQSVSAPYFPPSTDGECAEEKIADYQVQLDTTSPPSSMRWSWFKIQLKEGFKACKGSFRSQFHTAIIPLTWGIFLAVLAIVLALFAAEDQLSFVLSTRFWWAYGLVASALIWIGLFLPNE